MAKKPSHKIKPSNRDDGNPFHGPKAVKNTYDSEGDRHTTLLHRAEGGPVGGADVGLWERLRAGNIDEPGTEAYNRWGQGARNRIMADEDERAATAAHWRDYADRKAPASSGTESYEDETPSGRSSMRDNDEDYVAPRPEPRKAEQADVRKTEPVEPASKPKARSKSKPKAETKRRAEPTDVRRIDTGVDYAGVKDIWKPSEDSLYERSRRALASVAEVFRDKTPEERGRIGNSPYQRLIDQRKK